MVGLLIRFKLILFIGIRLGIPLRLAKIALIGEIEKQSKSRMMPSKLPNSDIHIFLYITYDMIINNI
jgi:hypothetical protein